MRTTLTIQRLSALVALASALGLGLSGCGADTGNSGAGDVTTNDSGATVDAASDSSTTNDAATSDDAAGDVATSDTATSDTALPDSTEPDSNEPDATLPDSTEPDATLPDSTEPDTTQPDSTEPDATLPDSTEADATPAPSCCKVDGDCDAGGVCFFGPWNAGKCMYKTGLPEGSCWGSIHCAKGEVCEGGSACGCDAKCKAMDQPGQCKGPGPKTCNIGMGAVDTDCGNGNFCKLDAKSGCAGVGVCTLMPQICNEIYAPVCGCDDNTYENPCKADGGGVNAKADGACVNKCLTVKCGDGNACTANVCDPKTGLCSAVSQPGQACEDGNACTKGDVCGDPGGTPSCVAGAQTNCPVPQACETIACNSVNGACETTPIPGCNGNIGKKCSLGMGAPTIDCGSDGYCELPPGAKCVGFGLCAKMPTVCTKELNTQCGCDGADYGNPCLAQLAGTNVASSGACGSAPGCCNANADCGGKAESCISTSGGGVCKTSIDLGKNQCWADEHCVGTICLNAIICPCGSLCKVPDSPGSCGGGGSGCCKQDGDCKTSLCAGSMCKDPGELKAGQCWTDAQCGGNPCSGASVCPCGAQCLVADKPGACKGN